jgi:tRNA-dihydrouridine synthase C
VADVRAAVTIPVVANGEIWSVLDADRCLRESGASALMLGRGAVVDPALAWRLRQTLDWPDPTLGPARPGLLDWPALLPHIDIFWRRVCERIEPRARAGRLKQWLNFLRRHYPPAQQAYERLRTEIDVRVFDAWVNAQPLGAVQALR